MSATFTRGIPFHGPAKKESAEELGPLERGGEPIYVIRARGNEDLVGKTIEFRAYNPSKGTEYPLTPSQNITFQLTGTYGYPSQLVTLALYAVTDVTLDYIELEVGETVNLLDYVHLTPTNATLPLNAHWSLEGEDVAALDHDDLGNLTLTGIEIGMGSYQVEFGENRYDGGFRVVKHATAIDIVTNAFTVERGDQATLTKFMRNNPRQAGACLSSPPRRCHRRSVLGTEE